MFPWNRKRLKTAPVTDPAERPAIPLPADTLVDRAAELHSHRQINQWIDEAYEEWVSGGGLENLPGKGKPLVVPTGDPLDSILKNAKAAPPWIMLRGEIVVSLEYALHLIESGADEPLINEHLREINEKIVQMNVTAPSLSLHRRKVTRETLREQLEKWR